MTSGYIACMAHAFLSLPHADRKKWLILNTLCSILFCTDICNCVKNGIEVFIEMESNFNS